MQYGENLPIELNNEGAGSTESYQERKVMDEEPSVEFRQINMRYRAGLPLVLKGT